MGGGGGSSLIPYATGQNKIGGRYQLSIEKFTSSVCHRAVYDWGTYQFSSLIMYATGQYKTRGTYQFSRQVLYATGQYTIGGRYQFS